MTEAQAVLTPDDLASGSTAFRLHQMNLRIDGVPLDLKSYPFWVDYMDMFNVAPEHYIKHRCMKKCSQIGATTTEILCMINRAQWLYPRGILYMFPGRDEVTDFSKARFGRLINDNECFRGIVGDMKSANLKSVGDTVIYFRGSRSLSQLESIPIDCIIFDERDKMEDDMVNVALYRLRASAKDLGHTGSISTPEFPEEGIDLQYSLSDQRMWLIRCRHCATETCLEIEWPNCLRRMPDGRVIRACKKCEREIFINDGKWRISYADRSMAGFWISQLCSPTVEPADILNEFETGFTANGVRSDTGVFHRRTLGRAYAEENARLSDGQVLACCSRDPELGTCDLPTAMGVDVNQKSYRWAVGINESETHIRVIAYGCGETEADILRIGDRFNVRCGVIDAFPEINSVAKMCKKEANWWRYQYDESRLNTLWNFKTKIVKGNRTQVHDAVQQRYTGKTIVLPMQTSKMEEFVDHHTAMYRTLTKHKVTQEATAKWRTGGNRPDDFRHVIGYLNEALTQVPVSPYRASRRGGQYIDTNPAIAKRATGSV